MQKQGAWMKWEQVMERRVTWKDIWQWNPQRIKFLIQGVYDVLPSPSNLRTWGKKETRTCPLSSKTGKLEHILSWSFKALSEGWYRWRHDQVLKTIAETISKEIKGSQYTQVIAKAIHFVREGQKPKKASKNCSLGDDGWPREAAEDWDLTSSFAIYSLSKAYGTLSITVENSSGAIGNNVEAAEKGGSGWKVESSGCSGGSISHRLRFDHLGWIV